MLDLFLQRSWVLIFHGWYYRVALQHLYFEPHPLQCLAQNLELFLLFQFSGQKQSSMTSKYFVCGSCFTTTFNQSLFCTLSFAVCLVLSFAFCSHCMNMVMRPIKLCNSKLFFKHVIWISKDFKVYSCTVNLLD